MQTRTKVLGGMVTAGLLYALLKKKPFATLKYKVTEASADGLTGAVQWMLNVDGKTYTGTRTVADTTQQTLNLGKYTFIVYNDAAGFPVTFKLSNAENTNTFLLAALAAVPELLNQWQTETA